MDVSHAIPHYGCLHSSSGHLLLASTISIPVYHNSQLSASFRRILRPPTLKLHVNSTFIAYRYLRLEKNTVSSSVSNSKRQEQQVYYDFLRIVLEILNCMISKGLQQNPELVYTLLHRQDVFQGLQVSILSHNNTVNFSCQSMSLPQSITNLCQSRRLPHLYLFFCTDRILHHRSSHFPSWFQGVSPPLGCAISSFL